MSGHSHFRTIKHKKELSDATRSQAFSKFANELTIAARVGGKDPASNPRLRVVIERAREAKMPSENIERAIKRGTGELQGAQLEELLLEAYGPGNAALLIQVITDNRNRSLPEIKQIVSSHRGKPVGEGGVRWMFDKQGQEWIPKPEMEVQIGEEDHKSLDRLVETLDEHPEVQEVYSNIKETA